MFRSIKTCNSGHKNIHRYFVQSQPLIAISTILTYHTLFKQLLLDADREDKDRARQIEIMSSISGLTILAIKIFKQKPCSGVIFKIMLIQDVIGCVVSEIKLFKFMQCALRQGI